MIGNTKDSKLSKERDSHNMSCPKLGRETKMSYQKEKGDRLSGKRVIVC